MSETLAYIAGIVDGEGCVGIKRSKPYKNLTGRVNMSYHELVQIRMVDEPAIRLLAETLGGWYYKEKPNANNGRPLYCYQATDKRASEILVALLPYLRVKSEQARIVLALTEHKRNLPAEHVERIPTVIANRWGGFTTAMRGRISADGIAYRASLWEAAHALNGGARDHL